MKHLPLPTILGAALLSLLPSIGCDGAERYEGRTIAPQELGPQMVYADYQGYALPVADWEPLPDTPGTGTLGDIRAWKLPGSRAVLQVETYVAAAGEDIELIAGRADEIIAAKREALPGLEVLDQGRRQLGGNPAYYFEFLAERAGTPMRLYTVSVYGGGREYDVSAFAPAAQWNATAAELMSALNGFLVVRED
jgi:hypothetical protein